MIFQDNMDCELWDSGLIYFLYECNSRSGFLGLHPFFTVKNGWKIKQKSLFLKPKSLFLHDTFFSLNCVCIPQGHPDSYGSYLAYDSSKRKKYHKKEKHTLSKEILKFRNKNFRSLTKCQIRYGKFLFLHLKISSRNHIRAPPRTPFEVVRENFVIRSTLPNKNWLKVRFYERKTWTNFLTKRTRTAKWAVVSLSLRSGQSEHAQWEREVRGGSDDTRLDYAIKQHNLPTFAKWITECFTNNYKRGLFEARGIVWNNSIFVL